MAAIPVVPNVSGYAFDRAADLTSASERERLSPSAIKAFVSIARKWNLNESDARALLGVQASSTYHAWRTKPAGRKLSQDTLTRISLTLGIYKALNIYFGQPWADRWVTLPNRGSMFAGRSPLDYMLRRGQPGMVEVRRLLDSWRGGV